MAYTEKFILLSHPRSGSTLVTLALQSHSDIRMFGELFHADIQHRLKAYGWGIERRPSMQLNPRRTKGWYYTDHQEGDRFLQELVYGDRGEDCPVASGFKLFYNHARSERAKSAWDYIRLHEELRIIHLVRANLLDCFVSIRTAETTTVWEVELGEPPSSEPPVLSIAHEECERYFKSIMLQRRQVASELFSPGRRVLQVEYERDILGAFDKMLYKIQEFLGVVPQSLPQLLQKQATAPTKARIKNYAELRRRFEKTEFAQFFVHNGSF
jgi:LPS sulfotransferase NodH